jgi:hypothetical protein
MKGKMVISFNLNSYLYIDNELSSLPGLLNNVSSFTSEMNKYVMQQNCNSVF